MNKSRTMQPGPSPTAALSYRVVGRPGQHDRPPLPPGHPVTWSMITAGTVLDGADYPYPVFLP